MRSSQWTTPLMVSKLANLPSHAHPQQEWRAAGEMEYYYKGNAKTVTSDKQSMALAVTGQGQVTRQYADSVLHGSLQAQTPPKPLRMENHRKRTPATCCQMT